MRIIETSYGDVRIFSERIFGYKRFIAETFNGKDWDTQVYSSLWYKLEDIKNIVEEKLKNEK